MNFLKSKEENRVLREFRSMIKQGIKEIILIAQDLGDYGKERKEKNALHQLIRKLSEEKGDFWIRFLNLYPDEIDEELIEIMKSDPRICPYLDMPIQHISNRILKRMHRKTSREQIETTLKLLQKHLPNVVVRTSLMVGFPGETEEEFEELIEFVKKGWIHHLGVFAYSREKDSHSDQLDGHISQELKEKRYEKLMQVQLENVRKQNQKLIGEKLEVMIEGYSEESSYLLRGRYYGQCPDVDGQVIINEFDLVDAFYQRYLVEITGVCDYDLIGKVLKKSS